MAGLTVDIPVMADVEEAEESAAPTDFVEMTEERHDHER